MIIDDGKQKAAPNPLTGQAPTSTAPAIVSQATPVLSNDVVLALLAQLAEQSKISAAREARLKKLEDEEDARTNAKKERYELNRKAENKDHLRIQAGCKHLKGGRFRKKNAVKDYGLSCHTYINGTMDIRCLVGCRMRWIPTDTKEFIIRDGRKLPNHTGLSWHDVMTMLDTDSSNEPSKSETAIPYSAEDAERTIKRLQEAASGTSDVSGLVITEA